MGWQEKLGKNADKVRHKVVGTVVRLESDGKVLAGSVQQAVRTGDVKAAVSNLSTDITTNREQKHAEKHAKRRAKLTKLLPEAELALPELKRTVLDGFEPTIQRADACIEAVKAMDELDFVNQTYGGYAEVKACRAKMETIRGGGLFSGGAVPSHAEVVEVMTVLQTVIPTARDALDGGGDIAYDQLKKFSDQLDRAFEAGMDYGKYAQALHNAIDAAGPAIEAYLMNIARLARQNQIPDERRKQLETTMKVFNGMVGIASHFVPPTYNAIPGAVKALSAAVENMADDALLADAAEKARKGAAPGTEFEVLEPLDIAKWLYAGHMKNAKLGVKMIGIAGEEIPGWSVISTAILKILESVLDRKLALAQALLDGKEVEKQSIPDLLFGSLQEELVDELKPSSLLETILDINDGEFDPLEWATDKMLETIIDVIAPKIAEWFPPKPAQAVNGDDLRGYVKNVLVANHPKWVGGGTAVDVDAFERKAAEGAPTEDKYGRKVEASDDAMTKHNADGSVRYYVAVKVNEKLVWGFINPQTLAFVAERPDNAALSDWSSRFIDRDSYRENGERHAGKWYKPVESQNFYLFVGADGSHEWAGGLASVGNTGTGNVLSVLNHVYEGQLNPSTDVIMTLNAV